MSDIDRIDALKGGGDPDVLHRMRTGWAVLGSTQHLSGYCLLVHDDAHHLTALSRAERTAFLLDLSLLGEAIQDVCSKVDPAFYRINYEILGNKWNHLHGHVHARYNWERQERGGLGAEAYDVHNVDRRVRHYSSSNPPLTVMTSIPCKSQRPRRK